MGRPHVVHDFDHERGAQHRGNGILTPVIQRLKMLVKYDESELEAAILNAIFAAYIESPYDLKWSRRHWERISMIPVLCISGRTYRVPQRPSVNAAERRTYANYVPGEKINTVNAARPYSNFEVFESAVLRNFSSGTGLSPQQVTQDWSDVNYSSARSSLLEAWKTLTRRRDDFATGICTTHSDRLR
jgi:capsid protein